MYLKALLTPDVDNQLELASRTVSLMMRTLGMPLPGLMEVPNNIEVRTRIEMLTQEALDSIEEARHDNPGAQVVRGEAEDELIKVSTMLEDDEKLVIEAYLRVN